MKSNHLNKLLGSVLIASVAVLMPLQASLRVHSIGEGQKRIDADHFRMQLSDQASLSDLRLWDGGEWYSVLEGRFSPDFSITVEGEVLRPCENWRTEAVDIRGDRAQMRYFTRLLDDGGEEAPWTLEFIFEVFPEGALFVDFIVTYYSSEPLSLDYITVSMPIPQAENFHRFSDQQVSRATPALMPMRFLMGMCDTASFTNEMEIFIENSRSLAGGSGSQTIADGRVEWVFAGPEEPVSSGRLWGFRYHNRIAAAFTRAAVDSDLSDSIGSRIFHWVNFLEPDDWHPTDQELLDMASVGATHLILHHEWMRYRGSNGYPPADYTILRDEAELRRTVAKARSLGMKVLLYIRGVEMYSLDAPIFQQRELYDGIYVDWHGAYAHSHHEAIGLPAAIHGNGHYSPDGLFVPGRDYFLFNRRMRELVGPNGSLMGHPGSFNTGVMMNLNFDGYLAGETSSERELFVSREHAVRLGMMASTVTMAWPEEASVFYQPEGAAKMAAWGIYPHIILGLENTRTGTLFPRGPLEEFNEPIFRYWNVLRAFDFSDVRVINHPAARGVGLQSTNSDLEVIGYHNRANGQLLVIVANLGEAAADTEIQLTGGLSALYDSWKMEKVNPDDGSPGSMETVTGSWQVPTLEQWDFVGFLLTPGGKE